MNILIHTKHCETHTHTHTHARTHARTHTHTQGLHWCRVNTTQYRLRISNVDPTRTHTKLEVRAFYNAVPKLWKFAHHSESSWIRRTDSFTHAQTRRMLEWKITYFGGKVKIWAVFKELHSMSDVWREFVLMWLMSIWLHTSQCG